LLLTDAVVSGSAQDVDEVAGAESLVTFELQPHDRREQLLSRNQAVEGVGLLKTGIAVAARRGFLPEVVQQVLPSAFDRLTEPEHRIEVLPHAHLEGAVTRALVDESPLLHAPAQAVGHPPDRRFAVATGSACPLVI